MEKHNIVLIASHGVQLSVLTERLMKIENVESVTVKENPFETEPKPFVITANELDWNPKVYHEPDPSKFISKPKHNYRKR